MEVLWYLKSSDNDLRYNLGTTPKITLVDFLRKTLYNLEFDNCWQEIKLGTDVAHELETQY